jgi:hypothetical protein
MVGESGTSRTGKFHQYYKCASAKNHKGCDKKTVKKAWIEDIVVNTVMEATMDDSVAEYIADLVMELQSRENTDLPRYKAQLADTEKAIANMLNAIQQGIFNKSTKGRLDELEAAKSELEIKILQEEMKKPVLKREQVIFWIKRFRKLDVSDAEQRQRLVDSFVNSVYLYDGRLVITFNYKEDSKTVDLNDIRKLDSLARNSATQNPANSEDCGVAVGSDYVRCLHQLNPNTNLLVVGGGFIVTISQNSA